MRTLAAGNRAPTLLASRSSLPPEGAELRLGRPGAAFGAPALLASLSALPTEGSEPRLGRPGAAFGAPTLLASCSALPPGGLNSAGGGPALRSVRRRVRACGFTLLELLIVLAIMAVATAGVSLALRDGSSRALEREAQRLAALFESARAQSRMRASPVRWHTTATGFAFDGLPAAALPSAWLGDDVQAPGAGTVVLGPEPVIGAQQVRLVSISEPSRSLWVATDGVRPFSVQADLAGAAGTP